jgi:TPR repeat protein
MAGCFQRAIVLESGLGVTQNFTGAAQLYREACEERHGASCARLAALYDRGAGVRHAPDRAKEFRKRACDNGYKDACETPKPAAS